MRSLNYVLLSLQSVYEHKTFSWKRNIDLFIMGFGYFAPCLHLWYCKIQPIIQNVLFRNNSKPVMVIGSMIINQLVFAPLLLSGFFVLNQIVFDRDIKSFSKGVESCKKKLWLAVLDNWKIWPLATTMNIWLVPVQYQVLFANIVGFFWNMILSFIAFN